jgi:predicted nucleic acid-binding protein
MAEARAFVDTNVFVYAIDQDEPAKRERALDLLVKSKPGSLVTSSQVLGEFFVAATRKLQTPLPAERAELEVRRLAPLAQVAVDRQLVLEAIALCASDQISYWDALIVRAAATAGCGRLLSEDLNDGRVIAGVRVENPFGALEDANDTSDEAET